MLTDPIFTIPQSNMSRFFLNGQMETAFEKKKPLGKWTEGEFPKGFTEES